MLTRNTNLVLWGVVGVGACVLWWVMWRRRCHARYAGMKIIPLTMQGGLMVNEEPIMGAHLIIDTGSGVLMLNREEARSRCASRTGPKKTFSYGTAVFEGVVVPSSPLPLRPSWTVDTSWVCPTNSSGTDDHGVWGICNTNTTLAGASFSDAIFKGQSKGTIGLHLRDMWMAFDAVQAFASAPVQSAHTLTTSNPPANPLRRPYVALKQMTVGDIKVVVEGGEELPCVIDTGTSWNIIFVPQAPKGITVSKKLSLPCTDFTFTVGNQKFRTRCPAATAASPAMGSRGLRYNLTDGLLTLSKGSFVLLGLPAIQCMGQAMNVIMERGTTGSQTMEVKAYELVTFATK